MCVHERLITQTRLPYTSQSQSRDLEKKMWCAYLERVLALLGRHEVIQVGQVHGESILLTRRRALLHLHMGIEA